MGRSPPAVQTRAPRAARALAASGLLLGALNACRQSSLAFATGVLAPLPQRGLPRGAGAAAPAAPTVKFYQFQSCPFCSKVRAYSAYNGVTLSKVEVNPVTKAEIKGVAGDYKKVPIADIDGEIVTGSADIIRRLGEVLGKTSTGGDDEWGEWVDSTLVKTLPPNIYRTPGESLQISGMVGESGNFDFMASAVAKYFGGAAMFFVAKKMAEKAGIEQGKEREALYASCKKWTDSLGDKAFMGGEAPSMADLEVYGVLSSVKGTDTHGDMLSNTAIANWYTRMEKSCDTA